MTQEMDIGDMSSLQNEFDDSPSWGSNAHAAPGDILRDAMRKEALIK